MPLVARVAHAFHRNVRERGEAYVRQQRVRIARGDDLVAARVRGSGGVWYAVALAGAEVGGKPVLATRCSCPHFSDGFWCKHLWATLRVLDQRGRGTALIPPGTTQAIALVRLGDGGDGEEAWDDVDADALHSEDDFEDPPPDRADTMQARARAASSPAPLPAWRRRLAALAAPAPFPSGAGESARPVAVATAPLLYLLDPVEVRESQAVRLRFARRTVNRDGSPGALVPAHVDPGEMQRAATAGEQAALAQLLTLAQVDSVLRHGYYGDSSYAEDPSRIRAAAVTVPLALLDPVLVRIAATGRLGLLPPGASTSGKSTDVALEALRLDDGPPWQLRLLLTPLENGDVALGARLVRDGAELAIDATALVLASGFLIAGGVLARADLGGSTRILGELRRGPLRIPAHELDAAVEQIARLPGGVPLDLARAIPWRLHASKPIARLRFDEIEVGRRYVEAQLHFGYGDAWIEADAPMARVAERSSRTLRERDQDAERGAVETLAELGFELAKRVRDGDPQLFRVAAGAFETVAHELLSKGWLLEVGDTALHAAGPSRASVRSGVDFFDLEGGIEFSGETVPFPALLAAAQKGSRFVRLAKGGHGLLPRRWLDRSARLADLGEIADGALRFGRAQVGILGELLDAQDEARADRRYRELRRKVADFTGIAPADAPPAFCGTLRDYQREGLGWLHFLREFGLGGCLADDMGLGKTVQVLALLAGRPKAGRGRSKAPRTSLVVAPKSVVDGWVGEAARFAPGLRVLRYEGLDRAALRSRIAAHDLVVVTYGTMLRDIEHLAGERFDHVILDEAQAIKNAGSRTARAAKALRAEHRLALTGTPVENHLGELASLLEFLNPGLLGRARGFGALAGGRRDAESLAILARMLRPFLLRRTKTQVLSELPAKTEQTLFCDLEGAQRHDYDELRRHYQASIGQRVAKNGLARSKIHVLEALLRLRQAACHPALIDASRAAESSAKLDLLFEQLDEVLDEGHKVLVFSQFTRLLARVRERLDAKQIAYAYLDGRTRDRKSSVARFQDDPAVPVFLISLKAGGTGLNLTAADYVFLLDPWWNPAVETQAIDRTHRIGQTRPVFAYRLVARATVEEKILELQERKRSLADGIFSSDESLIASLDAEELQSLLA